MAGWSRTWRPWCVLCCLRASSDPCLLARGWSFEGLWGLVQRQGAAASRSVLPYQCSILNSACLAQLSFGLSTEYSKKPVQQEEKSDKVDADRQLYAKYYVSQIMQLGEEGIRDAWSKVCSGPGGMVAAGERLGDAGNKHARHWHALYGGAAMCAFASLGQHRHSAQAPGGPGGSRQWAWRT